MGFQEKRTIQSGIGRPFYERDDVSGIIAQETGALGSYTKACGKRTLAP